MILTGTKLPVTLKAGSLWSPRGKCQPRLPEVQLVCLKHWVSYKHSLHIEALAAPPWGLPRKPGPTTSPLSPPDFNKQADAQQGLVSLFVPIFFRTVIIFVWGRNQVAFIPLTRHRHAKQKILEWLVTFPLHDPASCQQQPAISLASGI